MDNDGLCDPLDDDMDGDGVLNEDDSAPQDPGKREGIRGCTDAAAFNHNEEAQLDDGTCFTLEDAEEAVHEAMMGLSKFEATMPGPSFYYSNSQLQITMVDDIPNNFTSITYALIQYGEEMGRATYTSIDNGFIQVELNGDDGYQTTAQQYLVGSCLLYTSPSPRDATLSRMPSSA